MPRDRQSCDLITNDISSAANLLNGGLGNAARVGCRQPVDPTKVGKENGVISFADQVGAWLTMARGNHSCVDNRLGICPQGSPGG